MSNIISNDEELILKSLSHLNVIYELNKNNYSYEEFIRDKIKLDATIFHLTQVGELCTKYTDKFRENHKMIEFRDIIGLRNIMVHGYGTLHYDDIFSIIKDDVPNLIKQYNNIIRDEYNYDFVEEYVNNYYMTRKFDIDTKESD